MCLGTASMAEVSTCYRHNKWLAVLLHSLWCFPSVLLDLPKAETYRAKPVLDRIWVQWKPVFSGKLLQPPWSGLPRIQSSNTFLKRNLPATDKKIRFLVVLLQAGFALFDLLISLSVYITWIYAVCKSFQTRIMRGSLKPVHLLSIRLQIYWQILKKISQHHVFVT